MFNQDTAAASSAPPPAPTLVGVSDSPPRLDDQVCFAAYSAVNAIVRSYRPRLLPLGLTYPQYLVMMVLWQDGSSTVGQIATRLGLASHAVTPLVARLTAAGYLERETDLEDRRVVHIHLTEQGYALEHRAARAQREVEAELGLDEEARMVLRGQLHRVTHHLGGRTRGTAQPKKTSASA